MCQDNIIKVVDFISPLLLEVIGDKLFVLREDFIVSIEGTLVEVPKGFTTDLASVPRLPVVYLSLGSIGHKAAVLHDYLYDTNMYDRIFCDQYYFHALVESGVSKWKAYPMYWGVRVGGALYYNKKLKEKEDGN
jgi:hypothetical protein